MAAEKNVLGLIDASREVRRAPLVGMEFLHERPVRMPNFRGTRPRLQAKDLIGLLLSHFAAPARAPVPRCRIALRVLTPSGRPAVKIRNQ